MTNSETGSMEKLGRVWQRLYRSPFWLIFTIAASIFVAETVVMVILYLFPDFTGPLTYFVDASLLLVFLTPVLNLLILKPLRLQIAQRVRAEEELKTHQRNLEQTVADRTARLTRAVKDLEREVDVRMKMEDALQKSEERFRQLFQQSEDAIILFKPGTCSIIDINPAVENLYGFSRQELYASGPACFMKQDEVERFCAVITGLKFGDPFRIDSSVHRRNDGEEIIVSTRGKMVMIQNVALAYCSFRDVTKRVRLEEEARQIQAKLIHTNKMASLGVLSASIAHEINNPNNFILSNAQLFARIWDDAVKVLDEYRSENGEFVLGGLSFAEVRESSPRLVTGIVEGSRRINDIINNLKDLAREDRSAGGSRVDLNRVASLSASILNSQIRKCTERFRMELAADLPPVRGSLQQLEQVAINLVMNALQALPDKGRAVEVATCYDRERGTVELRVSDEGVGIPPEIVGRMLEPFFTTKLDEGGTGLGLTITNSIIKEHHGELVCETRPGEGTTFTVRLPVAEEPEIERP